MNIQGFDAVGRHTSTPQFQTPRSWNPRATFSLSRGAHFLKFGGEFLHVQTRINDLNATIGRMNFENRFTNRAVGDLLLGLPSQLALTSYTVMDQGQDMQFYFVQDDYRVTPKLTLNVGLRYEYATPPRERDNQFANFDPATGTMIFAQDGGSFERALIHPDRNNFAPRDRLRVLGRVTAGSFAAATACSTATPCGRGAKECSVSTRRISSTTCCRRASPARRPSPRRRRSGWSTATRRVCSIRRRLRRPFSGAAQDPNQRTPTSSSTTSACSTSSTPDLVLDVAYVGNKGRNLQRLPQPQPACGDHRTPDGSQAAGAQTLSGIRRHPVDGESRELELQLVAGAAWRSGCRKGLTGLISYTLGEALTDSPDHISTSGGGAGIDTGTFREPQDGNNLEAERGPAEFDVRHRFVASYVWELPFGKGRRFGRRTGVPRWISCSAAGR